MILSCLYTLLFAASGICLSEILFSEKKFIDRLWLGLALGLLLLTWLPSLLAFFIGFTLNAQWIAAMIVIAADIVCAIIWNSRRKRGKKNSYSLRGELPMLFFVLPTALIGIILLNTHVLYPHEDGSLWVGQVTYGDLAMHLGFITSIAEQGVFPPQYSIFPGHALNYPFLCETSGATLYLLSENARTAYLLSAIYAYIVLVLGVYRFMKQWLKKNNRAVLASVLFFFGGGFGFFYFFDLAQSGGILKLLLGTNGQTVSQTLLDGFYYTPTNIPALGLRWVNVIVDMLIPQRATLFGWAFLFPCLYLLHGFAFERKHKDVVMLGILAGLLPLIHTHSFLTLGIISAVYCISDLIAVRFEKKRLLLWLLYAAIACVLAAPQLFLFSFRQAAESSLVRFHLNWGNFTDSYLWFYIKNMGWIFLLMPFAFLVLPKRDKRIYFGVLAVWLISEVMEFQPNDYDNNKLLFIWFAFTCAIDAKLLCYLSARIKHACQKRATEAQLAQSERFAMLFLLIVFAVYFIAKIVKSEGSEVYIPSGTAFTLFFLAGVLLTFALFSLRIKDDSIRSLFGLLPIAAFLLVFYPILLVQWLKQYQSTAYSFSTAIVILLALLALIGIVVQVIVSIRTEKPKQRFRFFGGSIAHALAAYLLIFSMTVSGAMTIIREWKSEYQVYTANEVELSEQIKQATEPNAVILANSYHWNLVTPLTGRSIVTGTSTFLFYHGIDNTERTNDVRDMFEYPEDSSELFEKYNVRYVLITNAERMNYDIDYAYFAEHGTVVAQTPSGMLYRLP